MGTDIPIWLAKKTEEESLAHAGRSSLVETQSLKGRLVDLSEGGAAVRTGLSLSSGDLVELWSHGAVPSLSAVVAHVEENLDEGIPLVHLHFLDPATEIRELIRPIQVAEVPRSRMKKAGRRAAMTTPEVASPASRSLTRR